MTPCPTCGLQFKNHRALGGHFRGACRPANPLAVLFWLKVEKGDDGCWLYGRTDALGYGRFDRKGPLVYAHRVAWILTHGEIPEGKDVCHTCDVRNCCNPDHLFLGTAKDNMDDMFRKGRDRSSGEKNHSSKLTIEQVRAIRLEYWIAPHGKRSNSAALAAKYGVKQGRITSIISGRSWGRCE